MVKKSSLLNKLVGRWRTSPVEVIEPRAERAGDKPDKVGVNRTGERRVSPPAAPVAPEFPGVAEVLAQPIADRASGRKLSVKEEALLTMEGGLKELASLMRGVQVRLDAEGAQMHELANDIKMLPALGQAQLDVLRALVGHIEQQGRVGERLLQTMGELPSTLQGLRATLDNLVATDERTANTLAEFRHAMDTIQSSMREMVGHSQSQVDRTEKLLRAQDDRSERLAQSFAHLARGEQDKTERLAQSIERTVSQQHEHTDKLARSMQAAIESAVQGKARDSEDFREAVKGLRRSYDESVQALRLAHEDQSTRLQRMVEDGQRSSRWLLLVLVMVLLAVLGVAGVLLVT